MKDPKTLGPLVSQDGSLVETEKELSPLNRGTCVGYSIQKQRQFQLPDGRQITFPGGSRTESSDEKNIRISSDKTLEIALDKEVECVQFSRDWRNLAVLKDAAVRLFDFSGVLRSGTIFGNELPKLPTSNVSSVMFFGDSGNAVVTAESNRVRVWRLDQAAQNWNSIDVFRGESDISYAELDPSGQRLIVLEYVGGGDVRGILYSVSARQKWLDLGSDYKWLGAAFTEAGEIAVTEHSTWKRVISVPSLSTLTRTAAEMLSIECRPTIERSFRSSPCWPKTIQ